MIQELEHKVYVDHDIAENEHEYSHGGKVNDNVTFCYYNFKKGIEGKRSRMTYKEAIQLARTRRNDRRYKNFEFRIYK